MMNVTHQDFIQIFPSMQTELNTRINYQTLEDNESLTPTRFYLNIFFN